MASNETVREMFDKVIAETTDPETKAKRELLREYLTNPAFRAAMETEVARINGVR